MAHKKRRCDLRVNENTPPTFRERRHCGLARRCVAVWLEDITPSRAMY
jgi:hypothetical protein